MKYCCVTGKIELDIVRNAIIQFWPNGIQREGPKNLDPEHPPEVGQPKCYRFKLVGYPFTIGGSKENSTAARRMATSMLFNLYNAGWKVSFFYVIHFMNLITPQNLFFTKQ